MQTTCEKGLLQADKLQETFEKAFPFVLPKDEDDNPEFVKAKEELERVKGYLRGDFQSI